jgi:hypothetical protein
LYLFIDGRQQIEGFQIQEAEKCLPAVGGMARLDDKEFYDNLQIKKEVANMEEEKCTRSMMEKI